MKIPARRLSPVSGMLWPVDLNADLGEGFDDEALLAVVTSANVACGFHAGDAATMRRVASVAAARGVVVGAHVSYWDREGFGRRAMVVPRDELVGVVLYQLGALAAICRAEGTQVRYVKPHGALYNAAVGDGDVAAAVVEAIVAFGRLPVLGLPGSALLDAAAAAGLEPVPEGFPDRGYASDGTLLPRDEPGAVISDAGEIAARAVELAPRVRSLCVHGDSPGAVEAARACRRALEDAGVPLEAFA